MGFSDCALAQLAAATLWPPHQRGKFPFATVDDLHDALKQRGVLNSLFFAKWMSGVDNTEDGPTILGATHTLIGDSRPPTVRPHHGCFCRCCLPTDEGQTNYVEK